MTALTDARIERYSRQIIVPDVGPRGQLALLGARVLLTGTTDATAAAATLLARAGVGTLASLDGPLAVEPPGPDARLVTVPSDDGSAGVVVDLAGRAAALARRGRPHVLAADGGDALLVATLVGRPCAACAGLAPPPGVSDPAAALALGSLAAAEALRVLLAPPGTPRLQRLGRDVGAVEAGVVPSNAGCAVCR